MDDAALDDYLVRRARDGYLDAFEELVRRHQGRAYTIAVRMLGDAHEAEDAVQDAFVDAWRGLHRFHGDAAFGTWLYRIVVNRCLVTRRRRRPVPVLTLPEQAGGERPDEQIEANARDEALHAAIQGLPGEQRAPLVLVTFPAFATRRPLRSWAPAPAPYAGGSPVKPLLQRMRGWA